MVILNSYVFSYFINDLFIHIFIQLQNMRYYK